MELYVSVLICVFICVYVLLIVIVLCMRSFIAVSVHSLFFIAFLCVHCVNDLLLFCMAHAWLQCSLFW